MAISEQDIEHLMALARLRLARGEREAITGDLQKIIEYVGELSRADTAGIEPMAGGTELANRMRDDDGRIDSFCEEAFLLDRAPAREDQYFRAPRILE
jgi:aspartyl-tRNA(Asn)/glutamyl-tRNA(Gln) amidotransferase subunit C